MMKNPHKPGTLTYNRWVLENPNNISRFQGFLAGQLRKLYIKFSKHYWINNLANWIGSIYDERKPLTKAEIEKGINQLWRRLDTSKPETVKMHQNSIDKLREKMGL